MQIEVNKVKKVKVFADGYEITKEDGWMFWLDRKYGVVPHEGDEIKLMFHWGNQIHGIEIEGKIAFWKTKEQADKEHQKWVDKTRAKHKKNYEVLMAKIKDEDSFVTVDISGMGGGYERVCQKMLRAGIEYLANKPNFVFDHKQYKNIYGVCFSDSEHAKKLDEVLHTAISDYTGAMHQAVINHLAYIHKHGYTKWLEQAGKERQYTYPSELPAPTF